MGKQTIAESVETAAALDALRSVGIDFAQGNAIAPPSMFAPPGARTRHVAERGRSESTRGVTPISRPALVPRMSHDADVSMLRGGEKR
jgi:hypothetical protein